MADLAAETAVPVATIKYYLREGLLHAGEATAPNQARYDSTHVERINLIRSLREGAGLPLSTIARAIAEMDRHRADSRPEYLADAVGALSEPVSDEEEASEAFADAKQFTDTLVEALGWDVDRTSPGRTDLVRAVAAVHRHMPGVLSDPGQLRPFADTVRALAAVEIPDGYDPDVDREAVLRFSVLGTVLFEQVITSLRKLAHVDRIRELARSHDQST